MDNELPMTDDAILGFTKALATTILECGMHTTQVLESDNLSDDEKLVVMKITTFNNMFALLLTTLLADKQVEMARAVLNTWTHPKMRELINIAFSEEIDEAQQYIDSAIDDIEKFVNGES